MYRPEGFYKTIGQSPFAQEARDSVAFVEFIAEAMLEGLKKGGTHFKKGEWTDDATFETDRSGWVVFIPEEE